MTTYYYLFSQSCRTIHLTSSTKGQGDDQKNKFFLKKEDIKNSRGRYTQKPHMPRRSKSAAEEETHIEKSDSIGILSNDKEGIASVDPQDQIVEVLSVSQPQDVEDRQVHAQGRRLDAAALQAFKDRCDATNIPGYSGSDAYVDCVGGFVSGDSSTSCATACGGLCCTGSNAEPSACGYIYYESDGTTIDLIDGGFTGKGKHRVIHNSIGGLVLMITYSLPFIPFFLLLSFFSSL